MENLSPPHPRKPPAQHPPHERKKSTGTRKVSEIGFCVFIQNNMVAAATWFLYAWAIWASRDQCRQQLGGKFIHTVETVQPLRV